MRPQILSTVPCFVPSGVQLELTEGSSFCSVVISMFIGTGFALTGVKNPVRA